MYIVLSRRYTKKSNTGLLEQVNTHAESQIPNILVEYSNTVAVTVYSIVYSNIQTGEGRILNPLPLFVT